MADDAKKEAPIFASVTPAVRLENDALPDNPKRVIRTFAADIARVKGTAAPIVETSPSQKKSSQTPPVSTPAQPTSGAVPKPVRPTLADAVSAIPNAIENVPHLPPLQKGGEGMYVRRPEPRAISGFTQALSAHLPRPVQKSREYESSVPKTKPSFFTSLLRMLFGGGEETEARITAIPTISSYSPRDEDTPASEPITVALPETKLAEPEPAAPATQRLEPSYPLSPAAAESELKDRESVLARLRARVAEHRDEAPAPVYPAPKPEATTAIRTLPPVNLPGAAASPEKSERLHTMSSDFGAHIDAQKASAFSVLAAESDAQKPASAQVQTNHHRNLAYVLIATVLVVGGSLFLYYGYSSFNTNQPVAVVQSAPPTLVSGDDTTTLSGSGAALLSSLADAANAQLPIGTVRIAEFADSNGQLQSGGTLIAAINLSAPDILLRNLGTLSTVGIVHAGDETRAFFILSANSYERTFAGMLAWEPTITTDLAMLYPAYPQEVPVTAPIPESTTTATSTSPGQATTTPSKVKVASSTPPVQITRLAPGFVDEIVSNHDVRAYKDSEGKTVLLYGYRDQNTLIIARDETAFTLLLTRISAN